MNIPKLIHAVFVKNESHCISRMLDSVLPFVSESYIMIDDKTTDNTAEIVRSYGCHIKYYTFNNFGKAQNTMYAWVSGKSDWIFGLAPDETISKELGAKIVDTVTRFHNTDIDSVFFSRIHWHDLEMTQPKYWSYPDWQQRLIRNDYPRIHHVNYVHESVVGVRRAERIQMDINHFNLYWKSRIDYNWDEMHALYKNMTDRSHAENGKDIWPSELDLK